MKNQPNRLVYLIALIYALGVLAAMAVSEAVPELSFIAREFHPQNPAVIGLVMSLPSLVVAIGALAAGYLVDRLGDRPVLFTGTIITILGDLGVIVAPSLNLLLAWRLVAGVGYVLMAVSAITMLVRITTGKQRTTALALWSTFVPASFILPFLTAGLAAKTGTWRAAFAGHAGVLLALLILGLFLLPGRENQAAQPSRTSGLAQVLKTPLLYMLGICFGADAFLQTGIIATLGPYLAMHTGVNPFAVNGWNVGAMVVNTIGCLLTGQLLNRGFAAHHIGIVALVITGVPAVLLYAVPLGFMGSVLDSWIFTLGSGLLVGMWALLPYVVPSPTSTGAASGLVTQITLVGVVLGAPFAFAAQAASTSLPMIVVVCAGLVLCLAGLPVWLSVARQRAKATSNHPALQGTH